MIEGVQILFTSFGRFMQFSQNDHQILSYITSIRYCRVLCSHRKTSSRPHYAFGPPYVRLSVRLCFCRVHELQTQKQVQKINEIGPYRE